MMDVDRQVAAAAERRWCAGQSGPSASQEGPHTEPIEETAWRVRACLEHTGEGANIADAEGDGRVPGIVRFVVAPVRAERRIVVGYV